MKKTVLLALALVITWLSVAVAQTWVSPYTRKDGTHVEGHYRSKPDGNPYNNWSYPGNVNPYTGKEATGDPNRYLEQYRNKNDGGFGSDPYNPYRRR
jgi:opacity protein-like surface antigen